MKSSFFLIISAILSTALSCKYINSSTKTESKLKQINNGEMILIVIFNLISRCSKVFSGLMLTVILLQCFGCYFYPKDYDEFRRLPIEEQSSLFKQLPTTKQVDYYTYCARFRTCNSYELSTISARGDAIHDYLLKRMETSPDADKFAIACIFWNMKRNRIPLDEASRHKLQEIVNSIKDSLWKSRTEDILKEIL